MDLIKLCELEKNVLGSILLKNEILLDISDKLKSHHFTNESHQKTYEMMIKLLFKKKPIDFLTLNHYLKDSVDLTVISGLADDVISVGHAKEYVDIIINEFKKRKLHQLSDDIKIAINKHEDVNKVYDLIIKDILSFEEENETLHSLNIALKNCFKSLELAHENQGFIGLSTGIESIDEFMLGLKPAKVYTIAARPGVGKSSFLKAITLANKGKKILIFSLEMDKEELAGRYISEACRIDGLKIYNGNIVQDDWGKLTKGITELSEHNIYIDDKATQSEMDIYIKAKRFKAKYGLDLVLIDYLQLIKSSNNHNSRADEISYISRTTKMISKDLKVPVVQLSQLNRGPEKEKRRPVLSDLKESGGIEENSDSVLFLHYPYVYDKNKDKNKVEVVISKNRGGRLGITDIHWTPEYTKFSNAY